MMSGTSLRVQLLKFLTSTAGGMRSIPGWGTKIPHATAHRAKKKKRIRCFIKKYSEHQKGNLKQKNTDVKLLSARHLIYIK